jgi:hypothetical protein
MRPNLDHLFPIWVLFWTAPTPVLPDRKDVCFSRNFYSVDKQFQLMGIFGRKKRVNELTAKGEFTYLLIGQ